MIFRKLFGAAPDDPPPAELPVVRNVTVGRSVRLDPLAWRRLNESSFDLGRDTLDITAQGRIRLDDGSRVHRFYTDDDVMLQAVSERADGSDADDFTIFHPHSSRYPASEREHAAFLARLRRAEWNEEGLPPYDRFWYPGDLSDQEPVSLWEDIFYDRAGDPVSQIRQTLMLYHRPLEPDGAELLLAIAMQPEGGDLTHEIMIGLPLLPTEFTA
ncbi:MAG: FIG00482934: hypothetical protein [uncultured Sphingomonadaceae bacterium]|uniref:DUF2491 domain-containing protein n=1 Tax=uncultured Sphingomonadaceae bacterium TaxID=169976 RepID=A0A6J4SZV4_9SPHN|nr:MAG: FIG00482934: hypothetical protein [uncultured Sphingomonadaceae bacterium]